MLRRTDYTTSGIDRPYVPGAVVADALYRLDEAAVRMGWGEPEIRSARRRGLPVHRSGRRNYVLGKDLLTFVTTNPKAVTTKRRRPTPQPQRNKPGNSRQR